MRRILLTIFMIAAAQVRAADAPAKPAGGKQARPRLEPSPEERSRREAFSAEAKADLERFRDLQQSERAAQKEKEAAAAAEYKKSLQGKSSEERKQLQRAFIDRQLASRREFDERQKAERDEHAKERKVKEAAYRAANSR